MPPLLLALTVSRENFWLRRGSQPEFITSRSREDLLDDFLRHGRWQKSFCRKLLNLARQRAIPWETRCLAVLMAEHQILKLQPDDLAFDWLFSELNLYTAGALKPSLLKDGYSTTEPRRFIKEFHYRLARLDRVHRKIRGANTSDVALREFVAAFARRVQADTRSLLVHSGGSRRPHRQGDPDDRRGKGSRHCSSRSLLTQRQRMP